MNSYEKEVMRAQLEAERKTLFRLKAIYEQAARDVSEKLVISDGKIEALLENIDNADEQTKSILQSQIYQRDFQKNLKSQLDFLLKDLNNRQFNTISEYLEGTYENGFIGTLYNLNTSGIPVVMPIDPAMLVRAMSIDSKISKPLYEKLGEDVQQLKKRIANNIARGISTASPYRDIARNIASNSNTGFNNAMRIVRTESGRIYNAASLDSGKAAKAKTGADLVKVWDSTLDSLTRPHHRQLDNQVRELDEDFEVDNLSASAPGHFGIAKEDINCRCVVLIKPRWDLEGPFTKRNNETGELLEFKDVQDYEDFKKKFWNTVDNSGESGIINSGAISGALNPYSKAAETHAAKYYESVRHMTTDTMKISEHTKISQDKIDKIKKHVFIQEHDLINGYKRFDPSYHMAQSWQRLINGTYKEMDIVLLKHEYAELRYMEKGFSQNEAHILASKKYNYAKYCE